MSEYRVATPGPNRGTRAERPEMASRPDKRTTRHVWWLYLVAAAIIVGALLATIAYLGALPLR
jgi:hypothetical protein